MDNLVKFVLDSLNKHAYLDDSQISVLTTAKMYTEEQQQQRIEVRLRQLDNNDNFSYGNFN